MKTVTLENGCIAKLPQTLRERREMALGIQIQDREWQIPTSQRCGNDVSLPVIVLSLLTGCDVMPSTYIATTDMVKCAAKENIVVKTVQFSRIIQHMKRPIVSVRRENRAHGYAVKQMVIAFGGIHQIEMMPTTVNDLGEIRYYFGKSNSEVNHLRNTTYSDRLSQLWL